MNFDFDHSIMPRPLDLMRNKVKKVIQIQNTTEVINESIAEKLAVAKARAEARIVVEAKANEDRATAETRKADWMRANGMVEGNDWVGVVVRVRVGVEISWFHLGIR